MSDQRVSYIVPKSFTAAPPIAGVEFINDEPDIKEYLIELRRDLLRKASQLQELIAQLPDKKA